MDDLHSLELPPHEGECDDMCPLNSHEDCAPVPAYQEENELEHIAVLGYN